MTGQDLAPEDLVDAFVDAFNTRDLDAVGELIAADAAVHGIVEDAETPVGVLEEFQMRSPWMSLGRAEVGSDAVAAIWIPDENEQYRVVGYFQLEVDDGQITRIELFEDVPDDLLSETPPASWASTEVEATEGDLATARVPDLEVD